MSFTDAMPIYFAYGSNLDRMGMRRRCPGAAAIGLGRYAGHGFFVMADGYASVRTEPGGAVHGLLWSVTDADLPALDAYEEVASGLYVRETVAIERPDGAPTQAMIYIGGSQQVGVAQPGYMEAVIAAATAVGLVAGYCDALRRWLPDAGLTAAGRQA